MEKPSCLCSNWWRGPVYFTIAAMLAFLAITAAFHASGSGHSAAPVEHASPHLSPNASLILRNSGFGIFAALMQLSPDLFGSPSSNCCTVFAVKDSAIHSLGPLMVRDLAKYQTIAAANLSVEQLLKKPEKTCFETLLHFKNVSVTRKVARKRLIEINRIPISDPNLILEGGVTVHGVASPFAPLDQRRDFSSVPFPNPSCDPVEVKKHSGIQWMKILQSLRSKGYAAFAAGLQSVHPILMKEGSNLSSVTIFAPPDLGSVATPPPVLADIVKVHLLPRRFTYQELSSLRDEASLKTLASGQELVVTSRHNQTQRLSVSGVEITAPNLIKARDFMVHGMARAFEIAELHHSS
uniref:FAS1 domain-containing protein n=1 Tax=Kalanchoe fedtschenkoi TaxID=63787 RepID=A0A7N0TKA9_KALFE